MSWLAHQIHDPEFWVVIAFVLVIVLGLWKKVHVTIGSSLDARAAKIKDQLDEARKLREEAQAMLAEYQRKQRDSLQEAEGIVAHAKAEAERLAIQAAKDLEAALERRQRLALDKISLAEAKATAEVRSIAVDVAISAARQVIAQQLDQQRAGGLIDQAIAELPQRLH